MPDDDRWMAEAAMHRILRRTLPAQRHEVLGALSGMKLQLAVARRRLGRESPSGAPEGTDPAALATLVEGLSGLQAAAQDALTALRLWDGVTVQRRPLAEVVVQCVACVRQAAALLGHRLEDLPPVPLASPVSPAVQVPAAHHVVLALLYEALDPLEAPSVLQPVLAAVAEGGGWTLNLAVRPRDDGAGLPPLPAVPGGAGAGPAGQAVPRIDVALLQALARHVSAPDGRWTVVEPPSGAEPAPQGPGRTGRGLLLRSGGLKD